MPVIRKFLADTRDMILDGLAAIGVIRGGSVWWRERMRRRVAALEGEAENVRRAVGSTHRMCRECRALVPIRDRVCPSCGASMHGIPKGGAARVFRLLAPSFGSASSSLLGLLLVIYSVSVLTAPAAPDGQGGIGALFSVPGAWLLRLGAMQPAWLFGYGEWWRLINPIFLHASILHIGFNGYALANIGPALEAAIGSRRLFVVFFVTGVVSFMASAMVALVSPRMSVGASGAIFGLIGYGVVHGRLRGGMFRAFSDDLARWAIFGLVLSFVPGVDLAAHAGGLACGAVLGLFVARRAPRHAWVDRLWTFALLACVGLIIAGFALSISRLR